MVRTKEQINEYAKIYRDKNKEKISKNKKIYYKKFEKTDEWREKKNAYMRAYNKKNKKALAEKKAEYYKKYMSKEENKEKRRVYYRAYRLKNLEKCRAYEREYIKKPEQKERRRINQINFQKRNPKYATAHSMCYYFKNQKAVDETHAKWTKKTNKRYINKNNEIISNALSRARGIKGNLINQTNKTIKNDIKILQQEITKLREKLKQW